MSKEVSVSEKSNEVAILKNVEILALSANENVRIDFENGHFEDVDFDFLGKNFLEEVKDVEVRAVITGVQKLVVQDEEKDFAVVYLQTETGLKKHLSGLHKLMGLAIQVTENCGYVYAVKMTYKGMTKTAKGRQMADIQLFASKVKI
jgi:hypothetical protein